MKIYGLKKTTEHSPSQWEGRTADGRAVYIKYRSGHLQVGVGKNLEEAVRNAEAVYTTKKGGSYMSTKTMLKLIGRIVEE